MLPISFTAIRCPTSHAPTMTWSSPLVASAVMSDELPDAAELFLVWLSMEWCGCKPSWPHTCRPLPLTISHPMIFNSGVTSGLRSIFGKNVVASKHAFAEILLPISLILKTSSSRKVYDPRKKQRTHMKKRIRRITIDGTQSAITRNHRPIPERITCFCALDFLEKNVQ